VPPGATLGQLNPDQLDALGKAGLLNRRRSPPAELNDLGLGPTSPVAVSPFPTGIDGVGVGNNLPPGLPLGDVSQPGALYVGTGGVGTGGLSSLYGVRGSPGGLSAGNLGYTVNPGPLGERAARCRRDHPVGETMLSEGMGGMPYLPGMFGGMGQGQGQRDRTRNTWLKEDEEVWGTEPEVAPAVVGRNGRRSVPNDPDLPPDEPPNVPGENRQYRRR